MSENRKKETASGATELFVRHIREWVEGEMERDPLFAETVGRKPEKTVEGACNYVLSVVKQSRREGWDDAEVYGMVRHFYDEDELKDPGNQRPGRIVVPRHADLSENDRQEAMEQAKREYKEELRASAAAQEKLRREKELAAAEKRRKELEERREKEMRMQGDLFGGGLQS